MQGTQSRHSIQPPRTFEWDIFRLKQPIQGPVSAISNSRNSSCFPHLPCQLVRRREDKPCQSFPRRPSTKLRTPATAPRSFVSGPRNIILSLLPITTPSSTDEFVVRLSESLDCELLPVQGESNAVVDRTDEMESLLLLRFGERESNEERDLVGLEGSEARAFGKEGGRVFRWMMVSKCVFAVR